MLSPDEMRAEILGLLERDVRYFDASDDGLATARTAGEVVRRHAAREELAKRMSGAESAIRAAIELALPNMDGRDLTYTLQALRNCPEVKA